MDYEKFKEQINRYLDNDLDEETRRELQEQLKSCPLSSLNYEQEKKFDAMIKNHLIKENAPFELREAVIDRLEKAGKPKWLPNLNWANPVPAIVLSSILFVVFTIGIVRTSNAFPLFSESVGSHVTYLKGGYPMEIVSNDMKEVNAWFEGKLDFAVNLPDMSVNGLQLVGARLCNLKDKKVAYLTFEKDGHNISLFVMDTRNMRIPQSKKVDEDDQVFYVKSHNGYQSILCLNKKSDGTGCIFVSDLPEDELMKLII